MNHAKPSKRWIVPTAILVVLIVVLSIIYWPKTEEVSLPTLQEIEDAGLDPLGIGFPTEYPQFEPGDTVEIRDQIIRVESRSYVPFSSFEVWFPYKDGPWSFFNSLGSIYAIVHDDMGPYAPCHWIRLVGTVVNLTSYQGEIVEDISWKIRGGPGQIIPPALSMINITCPCSEYTLEINDINRTNNIIHYRFRLFEGELAIGDLVLNLGNLGLYMRFEDRGRIGYLDIGDRIHISDLNPGNYSLVSKYAGFEISNYSFVIES